MGTGTLGGPERQGKKAWSPNALQSIYEGAAGEARAGKGRGMRARGKEGVRPNACEAVDGGTEGNGRDGNGSG